jgi:hypothetical protein
MEGSLVVQRPLSFVGLEESFGKVMASVLVFSQWTYTHDYKFCIDNPDSIVPCRCDQRIHAGAGTVQAQQEPHPYS